MERYGYGEDTQKRRKLFSGGVRNDMPSILRLYAIKLEGDGHSAYIITGGGIKLASKMIHMKELQEEYKKVRSVQTWLEKQGIKTKEDLYTVTNGR